MGSTKKELTRRSVADKVAETIAELKRIEELIVANRREHAEHGDPLPISKAPFSLKSYLEDVAKEGVREGWIQYDAERGVACVWKPELPRLAEIGEDGWGTREWHEASHRRSELRATGENFEYLLGDGRLHALALRYLNVPTVEAGVYAAVHAAALSTDLSVLAAGAGAGPAPLVARIQPYLARVAGQPIETWEHALVDAVRQGAAQYGPVPDPSDRVTFVLEVLAAGLGLSIPERMRSPTKSDRTDAVRYMRTLRHADVKDEFLPPASRSGPGKPKSAWGAARDFSRCFQVPFPDKESHAKRRKK